MGRDTQLLKGILEGCVLKMLSRNSEHGYQVISRLRKIGFEDVQEATVYPLLTRLELKGLLSYEKVSSDLGPPRKVYSVTREGEAAAADFADDWRSIRNTVDRVLKEETK
jgi:PadR family transcriptional regulator, regulatory protein PadR